MLPWWRPLPSHMAKKPESLGSIPDHSRSAKCPVRRHSWSSSFCCSSWRHTETQMESRIIKRRHRCYPNLSQLPAGVEGTAAGSLYLIGCAVISSGCHHRHAQGRQLHSLHVERLHHRVRHVVPAETYVCMVRWVRKEVSSVRTSWLTLQSPRRWSLTAAGWRCRPPR